MAAYSGYTDQELTALLKSGDRIAFTEIYNRFFSLLYLHAFSRLRDKDDAKDTVQELFTALWVKHESISFTNLSNYLYTAVRNRVMNVISHKSVESKYLSALPPSVVIENCITDHRLRERQLTAIIEKEVAALPPKMRAAFELSRKTNMSHKEIANELGITEQSVRSHVKNALKILRLRLGLSLFLVLLFTY
ncbi:RNA polymerase sigma-70 factor (ECF subfamily) [Pedobacter sp. AK017]|uniref:RNA polymerase sigma-70 factor n=1 Tax=Pedobacter sp. AK017 TaxID=2723073 RepID=UPI001612E185|nr:RNA polymerase sigma-70 factor [Pedobacter sp. AK017]MBB5438804.1 RNA polymerase sigma-70 factor (ECF subfamily) [Pedobacter sp. AK017]